jgi:hypothetical protein
LTRIKDAAPPAGQGAAPSDEEHCVNHRHRKVLHAVFAHPLNHNIDPTILRHVLEELGAELRETGAGSLQVSLNGKTRAFHLGRHSVPGEVVMQIRHFLQEAGVDPAEYPV